MASNDPLKVLINETDDFDNVECMPTSLRTKKIIDKVQKKQSHGDILDFGFVKIWAVLFDFIKRI